MARDILHDVIIVGAGPIGSYTAYLLAKKGLDVGIIERNNFIAKNINCTGIISNECLKKFQFKKDVILKPIRSIKAFSPSGVFLRYEADIPFAYVIERELFDTEINRMALEEGATLYLNTKAKEAIIDKTGFVLRVKTEESEKEIFSRVGVIATGFEITSLKSTLKRPSGYLYGIQTEGIMEDIDDVEVYFGRNIAPGSFAWIVPTIGKTVRIGLIVKDKPLEYLNKFLQSPNILDRLMYSDYKIKCSPIPLGSISKSYAQRLLIVGEAAGQVKTTTGGGIYFGMLCSEIAVDTIYKAFQANDYSEQLFKQYEILWKKKIDIELKSGLILRSIFSKFSDHQIDNIIDFARRDGVLPFIKKSDFDWHTDLVSYLIRHILKGSLFHRR